jgi:hypothetical protein
LFSLLGLQFWQSSTAESSPGDSQESLVLGFVGQVEDPVDQMTRMADTGHSMPIDPLAVPALDKVDDGIQKCSLVPGPYQSDIA